MADTRSGRDGINYLAERIFMYPPSQRAKVKKLILNNFVEMKKEAIEKGLSVRDNFMEEIEQFIETRLRELENSVVSEQRH